MLRCNLLATLAVALAALVAGVAHGQVYPARPVRMVVPFAAGGSVNAPPSFCASTLATTSTEPPAANGTTMRTGRAG